MAIVAKPWRPVMITALLCSCAWNQHVSTPENQSPETAQHFSLMAMGTIWTLDIDEKNKSLNPQLIDELFHQIVIHYDQVFSAWNESSEVRKLEKKGLDRFQEPSELFLRALRFSQIASLESGGAFDITIGAVQWKILSHPVGMSTLEIKNKTFRFRKNPKRLSFDGLVKGMAVGDLSTKLAEAGFKNFRVDGGGGNQALAGRFLSENWAALSADLQPIDRNSSQEKIWSPQFFSDSILFYSASHPYQKGKAHIFDPKDPQRKFDRQATVLCVASFSDRNQWTQMAALDDAASKTVIIAPERPLKDIRCRKSSKALAKKALIQE